MGIGTVVVEQVVLEGTNGVCSAPSEGAVDAGSKVSCGAEVALEIASSSGLVGSLGEIQTGVGEGGQAGIPERLLQGRPLDNEGP